jgi:hypothetical protein
MGLLQELSSLPDPKRSDSRGQLCDFAEDVPGVQVPRVVDDLQADSSGRVYLPRRR